MRSKRTGVAIVNVLVTEDVTVMVVTPANTHEHALLILPSWASPPEDGHAEET
jgi:hypothetical protein